MNPDGLLDFIGQFLRSKFPALTKWHNGSLNRVDMRPDSDRITETFKQFLHSRPWSFKD